MLNIHKEPRPRGWRLLEQITNHEIWQNGVIFLEETEPRRDIKSESLNRCCFTSKEKALGEVSKMGFYEGKKKLDIQLDKILSAAKAGNLSLDLKRLSAQLAIECSPISNVTVMKRIRLYEDAGRISIKDEQITVL